LTTLQFEIACNKPLPSVIGLLYTTWLLSCHIYYSLTLSVIVNMDNSQGFEHSAV